MSSSEFNVSLSIEALSEMSNIIKRLTSETISLTAKNEALEKRIQELTPKNTTTMAMGTKCDAVSPMFELLKTTPDVSQPPVTSPLASIECQFCFKTHSKGECEYERWMDVLVDSVPVKPSAALKYVRIIHDEWVVVLVPDYYPVIVGECGSEGYTELDFENLNNIATRKSLAHFKTLDRNIYSIIDNKSKVISEWICQQGFDDSF